MANQNGSGSAALTACPQVGQPSNPGRLELVLFEHQDGRYVAAAPGAAFLSGDPKWHRAGPVTVHLPDEAPPAPAPQEGKARRACIDIECRAEDSIRLLDLAAWIEEARELLAVIQAATPHDKALGDRLRANGARYMIDWSEQQSSGLTRLLAIARDNASAIVGVACGARRG